MTNNVKSKAIVLGMLFKVDVANPNAGWTEETITPLKKIEAPDNQRYPYISGQALRRYLRDTLTDIIESDDMDHPFYQFSPEEPGPDSKSPILTAGRPDLYIDDDLFGFMRAVQGETRKRESPLRLSAAFGLFPYVGDRDLGTRSALKVTGNPEAGGSIFETEVTNNVFRTTWLLDLDRTGKWFGYETTGNSDTVERFSLLTEPDLANEKRDLHSNLTQLLERVNGDFNQLFASKRPDKIEEKLWKTWKDSTFPQICKHDWGLEVVQRRKRVQTLLQAIKYLNGGARQARLLIELVPQFVIYARLTKKLPLFLNTLQLTASEGQYCLAEGPITEIIGDYATDIQSLIVGLRHSFGNIERDDLLQQIKNILGEHKNVAVTTVGKAVDAMVTDMDSAQF